METAGRSILEGIIKVIAGMWSPNPPDYFSKIAAVYDIIENTSLVEEPAASSLLGEMLTGITFRQGMLDAFSKRLVGTNVFTPCLVSRGWAFWQRPLLTDAERKSVEVAHDRWIKRHTKMLQELTTIAHSTEQSALRAKLPAVASGLRAIDAGFLQLSADLEEVLNNTHG